MLMALMTACSAHVPLSVELSGTEANKAPEYSKVVILLSDDSRANVHTESGLLVVGLANSWDVEVGQAMEDSVVGFFKKYYKKVEVQKGPLRYVSCNDCSLIIRPKIESINISKVLMQAEVKFTFRITTPMNKEVIRFSSVGKSKLVAPEVVGVAVVGLAVPFFGDLLGSYLVADIVEDAFENAYIKLSKDMDREINTGVLARTWLPKDLIKKGRYGRSEFSAERLARSQGCDLRTDGLKMLTPWPSETYDAYCWGKDAFQIQCEFGQCAISLSKASKKIVARAI